MNTHHIAQILREIAFFLLLKGDNPCRGRAYHQAATAILTCPEDLATLVERGSLAQVKGIGPATASVITELLLSGSSTLHDEARGEYPSTLSELWDVPGLSLTQVRRLYDRAGICSLADLQAACAEGRLLSIPGFEPQRQARIREALGQYERGQGYHLYADILDEAEALLRGFTHLPGVQAASLAGVIRRKVEVANRLHIVVAQRDSNPASLHRQMTRITNLTDLRCEGLTVTARSPLGLPLAIQLTTPEQYGLTLLLATGSPEHLEGLLGRFIDQGFAHWDDVRTRLGHATRTEEAVYEAIGLAYIPPELREGRAEITWASTGRLPALIEAENIQGFFHTHTTYTDGANTLTEMAAAARERGYRYIGISDHSQAAHYVNGLKEARIRMQWAEIEEVQRQYGDIHIFKGIEADILPDGTIDYPDELLAQFDFVIASVHSRFNLSKEDQTRRICRALSNRYVTMLGHPTGRLLLSRSGYCMDVSQVLDAAAKHGKMIEINGSRHRLDLDWRWAQQAKDRGIALCVNPDAHAVHDLGNVELGVNVARKGGLAGGNIANTYSLMEMKTLLRNMRNGDCIKRP